MMIAPFAYPVLALLIASGLAVTPAPGLGQCDDPLPIDPAIVTQEMKLKAFAGADQMGPVCHLRWEAGVEPGPYDLRPHADRRSGADIQLHEAGGRPVCRRVAEGG